MNDLSSETTDDLLEEIMKRHTSAVFIGRPIANREFDWHVRTNCAHQDALGLATLAQAYISDKILYGEDLQDPQPNETG